MRWSSWFLLRSEPSDRAVWMTSQVLVAVAGNGQAGLRLGPLGSLGSGEVSAAPAAVPCAAMIAPPYGIENVARESGWLPETQKDLRQKHAPAKLDRLHRRLLELNPARVGSPALPKNPLVSTRSGSLFDRRAASNPDLHPSQPARVATLELEASGGLIAEVDRAPEANDRSRQTQNHHTLTPEWEPWGSPHAHTPGEGTGCRPPGDGPVVGNASVLDGQGLEGDPDPIRPQTP